MSSSNKDGDEHHEMWWRRVHTVRAKLKATGSTSHILCAFAMMAAAELQVNNPEESNVPDWLWVLFITCTIVLVAIQVFALTIASYILPNLEAVTSMEGFKVLPSSPHEKMATFIELAYFFSKVIGLLLFLVELGILCWVKFWDFSFAAATAGTIVVAIALVICITFAVKFHHSLLVLKVKSSDEVIQNLEIMRSNLRDSELFNLENEIHFS